MNQQKCINNAIALMLLYGYYEYYLLRKDEWCELQFKVPGSKRTAESIKNEMRALVNIQASVQMERIDGQDATLISILYTWR